MPEPTAPNPPPRRTADLLLIVLFLAATCLPGAARLIIGPPPEPIPWKRVITPPQLASGWRASWDFTEKQFCTYWADNFTFKPELIRLHALVVFRGLHASPSPLVRFGDDGWLFYTADDSFDDYRSRDRFADEEMANFKRVLEERRDWLASQGSKYLIVFVPDKHAVYGEFIPRSIRRVREEYAYEQLTRYLADHSTLEVLNLGPALHEAKKSERLFHRTDTHWNDLGAYVGYREIMNRLSVWFPALGPLPRSEFTLKESRTPGWDLAEMLKLSDQFTEDDFRLVPREPRKAFLVNRGTVKPLWDEGFIILETPDQAPDKMLPRLVVLRDSFGSALVPFLAEHFSHSYFAWDQRLYLPVINRQQPDVVIQEIATRKLRQFHDSYLYNPPELGRPNPPTGEPAKP